MKKILLSFMSLALVLTLGSCDLDEPNYGKTTSDNFYKKQSDIMKLLQVLICSCVILGMSML